MKRFIFAVGQLFHVCFSSGIRLLGRCIQLVYCGYVSKEFKRFGKESIVEYPLYVNGGENIEIGNKVYIGKRLRIETFKEYRGQNFEPSIRIGDFVGINHDCHIAAIESVEIGNNVLIASKVYIADHSHGDTSLAHLSLPPVCRPLVTKGKVIIEDDVWIGEGAAILPGVVVGKGAIIGTNAVVTKDVAPFTVVGGAPASVIKKLL